MAVDEYEIVDVTEWRVAIFEPRGGGANTWLEAPDESGRWLFKPVTQVAWGLQGEDRAEKTTCEVARLLGIPRADVELATRADERGIISRDLAPAPWELQTGAVLLSGCVEDYQPGSQGVAGRPGHSLSNIRTALGGKGPPPNCSCPASFDAFDVFVGFLVLDALVANRDRHDENWAVLRPPTLSDADVLCPSYDHGSSVGFNLQRSKQELYLNEGRLDAWACKGDAHRFEHISRADRPSLVELAAAGLQMAGSGTRSYWLHQVSSFTHSGVRSIVDRVPGLSDVTRRFTVELLMINRRRLLDEC